MAEPVAAFPIARRVRAEIDPAVRNWPEASRIAQLRFIEAWAQPLQPLDDIVRDNPGTGAPGYSSVMHPDTAPAEWLDWLAQFTGTTLSIGDSTAQKRQRIKGMEGLRRGSPQAIESVVRHTLTNYNATVYFLERYGSAYRLGITTLNAETPDPDLTEQSAKAATPAGIVVEYTSIEGGIQYDTLTYSHASYNEVQDLYADYNEVLADPDKQ